MGTINRSLAIVVIATLGGWGHAEAGDNSPTQTWSGFYGGVHVGAGFGGPDSSLTTSAHTRQFKTIGHGECFDAAGNEINPPIGANKAKCEEPTVMQNPYTFQQVAGANNDLCTINGVTTLVNNENACRALAGTTTVPSPYTWINSNFLI